MTRGPDRDEARRRYDRMAVTYDRQLAPLRVVQDRLRRAAVARLGLSSGNTVIDAGCGTGASFELLAEAVGPGGRVIGVDQSAGMLTVARRRITDHGLTNVSLVEAPLQEAAIDQGADAALFFFTHDLLRTPAALDNVVGGLRPGGRVAAAGARMPSMALLPIALPAWLIMRRYVTTRDGLRAPWTLLAERLDSVSVHTPALGATYLFSGRRPVVHAA